MKRLVIEKGEFRLYLDPNDPYIRICHKGAGLGMLLTKEELVSLSRAAWYSAQQQPASNIVRAETGDSK